MPRIRLTVRRQNGLRGVAGGTSGRQVDRGKGDFEQRRARQVVHHSDPSVSPLHSYALGKRCREMNVLPSMGAVGNAFDNAMAESLFATPKK